ncbi:MAG: choice-of-anchor D domain-containing protein, partial [Bryobacterales bacterium]|nr:choice-of-anchor D domain-containing protein [Bryobacterales bacterium]
PRELPFTVSNSGTAPLNITSVSVLNARFTVLGAGPFTLNPGAARSFLVRFSPTVAGEQSGSLSIATNDPATPSLRLDLRGTGVLLPLPQIDVNLFSLDFQGVNLNQSRALALNVRNGGTGALTISAFNISNSMFAVSSPVPPIGVAPGATQVVSLRFAPTAQGPQTGTLTLVSNDPSRPQVTVQLSGNGLPPQNFPLPRISSVHPAAITAGGLSYTMTVAGSNFTASSQGLWNGVSLPTRYVSPTLLKVTVPAQTVASAQTASVTVSNPSPGGGSSNGMAVFIDPPGAAARIVATNLTGCPTVIHTLTVTDPLFTPITTLGGGNVACSEEGAPIPCTAVPALQLNSQLSALIVLHASASISDPAKQRLDLGSMQRYATTFINTAGRFDRLAITQMDNGVRLRADFRDAENRPSLLDQVNQLLFPLGNGTALYDAIEDGINRLQREAGRRKALLIFTGNANTYDTNGPRDLDAFSQFLQSSGVPIYFVPLGDALTDRAILSPLYQMALDSGGHLFSEAGIDFGPLMGRLSQTLQNQPLLNYDTPNRDGQPRQSRIVISIPGGSFTTARSYSGCR